MFNSKKLLGILLVWLAFSTSAFAAISSSPVQQVTGTIAAASNTTTLTLTAPTNGNTLVLVITALGTEAATISTVVETNVTWTLDQSSSNTNAKVFSYRVTVAASASTSLVVTLSGNATVAWHLEVSEWSGIATSSPLDVNGTNAGTSSVVASGTISPTAGLNELIIVAGRNAGSNAGLAGPTNSFTFLTTPNASTQIAYLVVASTTGTYSTGWNYTTNGNWNISYATYQATIVAGAAPQRSMRGMGTEYKPPKSLNDNRKFANDNFAIRPRVRMTSR